MHRYFLYLTVAVLTFGFGILMDLNFYPETEKLHSQIHEENEVKTNVLEVNNAQPLRPQFNSHEDTKKTSFTCENSLIKPVWNKMMKSESFKDYLDVGRFTGVDNIDCEEQFNAKLIDVNDDGVKEIAIQGKWSKLFCGMYSGCSFWVFQKRKEGYHPILIFGDAFDYKVGRKKQSGFRNLIVTENHGNYGFGRYTYQYNGKKYQPRQCFLGSYDVYELNEQKRTNNNLSYTKDDCPKEEN